MNGNYIETERLIMRHFKKTDADDCFGFLSDEQTCLDSGGYHAFEAVRGIINHFFIGTDVEMFTAS